jgi:hypothetical protein
MCVRMTANEACTAATLLLTYFEALALAPAPVRERLATGCSVESKCVRGAGVVAIVGDNVVVSKSGAIRLRPGEVMVAAAVAVADAIEEEVTPE